MASPFRLKTALPDDVLRVHACTSREGLSEAGDTTLTLLSERKDILASELLGKLATLTIALREDAPRHLSGYVTRFAQRGLVFFVELLSSFAQAFLFGRFFLGGDFALHLNVFNNLGNKVFVIAEDRCCIQLRFR